MKSDVERNFIKIIKYESKRSYDGNVVGFVLGWNYYCILTVILIANENVDVAIIVSIYSL